MDLGCLYELQDGTKSCVQALGKAFGSLDRPHISKPFCPFCHQKICSENIVRLRLKTQRYGMIGQWIDFGEINVYHNMPLFRWHFHANTFPDEKTSHSLQAYIYKHENQWLLVNHAVLDMTDSQGKPVPPGQAVVLNDGAIFRASERDRGLLIEVALSKN